MLKRNEPYYAFSVLIMVTYFCELKLKKMVEWSEFHSISAYFDLATCHLKFIVAFGCHYMYKYIKGLYRLKFLLKFRKVVASHLCYA